MRILEPPVVADEDSQTGLDILAAASRRLIALAAAVALATGVQPALAAPSPGQPVRLAAGSAAFPAAGARAGGGADGLPRADRAAARARARAPGSAVDLVELAGADAGPLIAAGRLAVDRGDAA